MVASRSSPRRSKRRSKPLGSCSNRRCPTRGPVGETFTVRRPPVKASPVRPPPRPRSSSSNCGRGRASSSWRGDRGDSGTATSNVHLTLHEPSEPPRVHDRRLGIELTAIHDNLWRDGRKTWASMKSGGDCLEWISTATMISDCLTKSMKPDFMLRVLKENLYRVQKQAQTRK